MTTLRALACVVVLVSGTVSAADPAPGARELNLESSRSCFRKGREYFAKADYSAAIEQFEAGYALSPQPLFLYNIALSYRLAGQLSPALDYYRRFAAVAPRAPERAEVEARIADLERALTPATPPDDHRSPEPSAPEARTSSAPSPRPAPPSSLVISQPSPDAESARRARSLKWAGGTLAVVGGVGLILGATFVGLAANLDQSLNHPVPGTMFDPALEERRDRFATSGLALLVSGGVVAIGGTALALVGARRSRPR
jgi:tetratricopeptide (TPR) repeat protein